MVEKLPKEQVDLLIPKSLDVLLHLPASEEERAKGVCTAIALQYNVSVDGLSPEEAITDLVDLVIHHCSEAREMGIVPIRIADIHYLAAFMMGDPVPELFVKVHARMSKELAKELSSPDINVHSVCAFQERMKLFDIEEFATKV